jgi:hypothetical protein
MAASSAARVSGGAAGWVGSVGVLQAPKLLLARLAGAAFASSGGGGVPVGEAVENDSRYDAIVDNGRKRLLVQVNYGAGVPAGGVCGESVATGTFGESAGSEDREVFRGGD